jgi:hypothetical protein
MTTLFSESFSKLNKFIFDFYDFDKDGKISKEDVRVVLSYIPLNTQKYSQLKLKYEQEEFKDRVESQDELHNLLEKSFGTNEVLDHKTFQTVVENKKSEMFLFILIFLLDKRPFSKQTLEEFKGVKKSGSLLNPTMPSMVTKTPQTTSKFLIASPNLQSKFSPSVTISKSPSMTKRNTAIGLGAGLGGGNESKNMLLRLAGKETASTSNQSILLKYAGGGAKPKEEENTDEGVSINNIKNIPIQRKQRHNLKDIETLSKESIMKNKDYEDLPITPAVKLAKNKLGEEE